MYDRELVIDILHQIDNAIDKILYRSTAIKFSSDFTDSPEGMEKLDSICMQLIDSASVNEAFKSLAKLMKKYKNKKAEQVGAVDA